MCVDRVVKERVWVLGRAHGPALGVRQFRQLGPSGRYEVAGDHGRSNLVRGGRFLESQDFGWLGFGVRWEEERLRQVSVSVVPFWRISPTPVAESRQTVRKRHSNSQVGLRVAGDCGRLRQLRNGFLGWFRSLRLYMSGGMAVP